MQSYLQFSEHFHLNTSRTATQQLRLYLTPSENAGDEIIFIQNKSKSIQTIDFFFFFYLYRTVSPYIRARNFCRTGNCHRANNNRTRESTPGRLTRVNTVSCCFGGGGNDVEHYRSCIMTGAKIIKNTFDVRITVERYIYRCAAEMYCNSRSLLARLFPRDPQL